MESMPAGTRVHWSLVSIAAAALALSACSGAVSPAGGSLGSTPPAAPTITTQPANQSVAAGLTATFTVSATGTQPLSYQWQENGTNIPSATASSYTTPATTSADNGETFDVVVSNTAGSVTSNTATLTVTSTSSPPATGTDITTFHNDVARDGLNATETTLTPSNVNVHTFGLLRNLSVDGKVDAEPLYLSGLTIGSTAHNAVFVATENDSMFAFDSDTGATLWQDSSAQLLPSGETTSDTRSCGQVTPQIGITSTPVIDRSAGAHGTIFFVVMSKDSSGNYHQRLHALDVTTGAELLNGPAEIKATYPGVGAGNSNGTLTFAPGNYKERAALLLLNGTIYLSFASHCDIPPYSAWVMGYSESSLQQTTVLNLTPNGGNSAGGSYGAGAIWQSGGGPAADAQGNIYIEMANGDFETSLNSNGFPSQQDFGNAFVKLSLSGGKLAVADYFTMTNTVSESDSDTDLGSGGPLVLPDITNGSSTVQLAIAAGKDGTIYVANRNNMGKFNPTTDQIYQELPQAVPEGVWGVPAYFNNTVYYCDQADTLKAFPISNAKLGSASSATATNYEYPGALPSVSANGTANGIVWAIENTNPAILHAYSAGNLGTELYNSNQAANGVDNPGAGNKFITPAIADGKVFVATTNSVAVYGLLPTQR
jgi:hypothetical protein